MRLIQTIAIIVSLIWFISCGGKDSTQDEKGVVTEVKQSHVMVKLPTVQCSVCKNTIETGLRNVNGILSVNVDVENLVGHINYNPGKIKINEIETAISALGYQANDTEADPDAYANLPSCCKLTKDR